MNITPPSTPSPRAFPFLCVLAIWFILPPKILAQDTLFMSDWIATKEGSSITVKYRSELTGAKQSLQLSNGTWNYFDKIGNLIKSSEYQADKAEMQSYLHGKTSYFGSDGKMILTKIYFHGRLKETQAYEVGYVFDGNTTIHISEQMDKLIVSEYVGFKPTIGAAGRNTKSADLGFYMSFERARKDSTLLQPQSFAATHFKNHITNPGFEDHPNADYSYRGIGTSLPGWREASPSPDFYLSTEAFAGNGFLGFRPFGIVNDIEYIQNELVEPLKKNQMYCFSVKIKLAPNSGLAMNQISVFFSPNPSISKKQIFETPQLNFKTNNLIYKSQWMTLQCIYTAHGGETYATLGTFTHVDSIKTERIPGHAMEVYYYIDDVSLVPIDIVEECPCTQKTDITSSIRPQTHFTKGQVFVLNGVFFENDKDVLLPESQDTLNSLLEVLIKHPNMVIEISGHTSLIGGYEHNMGLSDRRAIAVKSFLIQKGIHPGRLQTVGYGPNRPIATNANEEGQALNRRVEIKILNM